MGRYPLYIQLRNYLLTLIKTNQYKSDYVMPSENMLSIQFNISRTTARNALLSLKKEGLIYPKQGKGYFINENLESEKLNISAPEKNKPTLKKILLIVPNMTSFYYCNILSSIMKHAKKHNFSILLELSNDDFNNETEILYRYINEVSGVIIIPANNQKVSMEFAKKILLGFPIVLIDNYFSDSNINYVSSDNFQSMYDATKYLINNGAKNLGLITNKKYNNSAVQNRVNGFKECMKEYGMSQDIEKRILALSHTQIKNGTEIKNFLIENKFDGLLSVNSGTGIRTLEIIKNNNISINFNNVFIWDDEFGPFASLISMPVNFIHQDIELMAQSAMNIILKQFEGADLSTRVIVPTKLIIRK